MNLELAKKVADAVLYEGYMLYPYRPSAIKNRQRWSFGILYPPTYVEVGCGTERCGMHSECLLKMAGDAALRVQLRFLHLIARQVTKAVDGNGKLADGRIEDGRFEPVPSLVVDGHLMESWDEGIERSVEFELQSLEGSPQQIQFRFQGSCEAKLLQDRSGRVVGSVSRTQHEVTGTIAVSSEEIADGVLKLTIDVTNTTCAVANHDANTTPLDFDPPDRNAALLRSLLSAHTILAVNGGEFVSLLEPPEELRDAVLGCRNVGNFPVLVGAQQEAQPERDMLFCSPITLYDYPQIAPESASDFYDATEMDEMLTLRVMTLTDEEKDEMRSADDHARNLLQRTEQNAREQLMRTHGVMRSLRPTS